MKLLCSPVTQAACPVVQSAMVAVIDEDRLLLSIDRPPHKLYPHMLHHHGDY